MANPSTGSTGSPQAGSGYELTAEDVAAIRRLIALLGESGELRKANTRYRDMLQKHADLMEEARGIFDKFNALDGVLREYIEEHSKQSGDIERLLLLERTGNQDSPEAKRVRRRMKKRQDDEQLRRLLQETQVSLDEVLIKIAQYGGSIDAPVRLIRQREELTAAVEKIKEELGIVD